MWELVLGVILVYTAFQVSGSARLAKAQENRLVQIENTLKGIEQDSERARHRLTEIQETLMRVEKASREIEREIEEVHALCDTIAINLDDLKVAADTIERMLEPSGDSDIEEED